VSEGVVLVAGSVNVDLMVQAARLPVAGETVAAIGLSRHLGGKGANQAVAAARAGGRAVLVGAIGDDVEAAGLLDNLRDFGVSVDHLRVVPGPTGIAIVATSPSDNQIMVVAGANAAVTPVDVEDMPIQAGDVCLAQMETPAAVAAALFRRGRQSGAHTVLNPSPMNSAVRELLPLVDVLVLNEGELAALAGQMFDPAADDMAGQLTAARLPSGMVLVVTLGGLGLALIRDGVVERIAGHSVTVTDTTGAGDCFCGYLAAALARGAPLPEAAREANAAAALAVQGLGAAAAIPERSAVLRMLGLAP